VAGSFVYFITGEGTQKSKNLSGNPYVSLAVIEKSELPIGIQAEGKASIVTDKDEANRVLANFTKVWYAIDYTPPVMNIPKGKALLIRIDIKNIQWFQTAEKPENIKMKKIEFNYTKN